MPSFDMTITREDFVRLLPAATNSTPVLDGDCWSAPIEAESAGRWVARFEPLPPLGFGLIRLERHRLQLSFERTDPERVRVWMERFWRYYHRGGG
jgi:hypothetical protein